MNNISAARVWRILVVDENGTTADLLRMILDEHRFEVLAVGGQTLGLVVAESVLPHAILIDFGRIVEPAIEFARRVRQNHSLVDAILIAMTGWSNPDISEQITQAGYKLQVTKPVNFTDLVLLLKDLLIDV